MDWVMLLENAGKLLVIGIIVCFVGVVVTAIAFPDNDHKLYFVVGWSLAVVGVMMLHTLNSLVLGIVAKKPLYQIVPDALILHLFAALCFGIRRQEQERRT